METLEGLQAILDDAPKGKTHVCVEGKSISYWDDYDCDCLAISDDGVYLSGMSSLADIQRIVDLIKLNQEMHQQVNGYLHGEDWEHWQAFNQKRFEV